MGRRIGEHWAAPIRRLVTHRLHAAREHTRNLWNIDDSPGYIEVATRSYRVFKAWDPAHAQEHDAIAIGAGVDAIELHAAAQYTDLRDVLVFGKHGRFMPGSADAEGCTAFALPHLKASGSGPCLGQTWDLHPDDLPYVAVVERYPENGPSSCSLSLMGFPALIGLNGHGLYVGTTNIKTHDVRPGVGYLNLIQAMLACENLPEAVRLLQAAPRCAAHTFWLGDPKGAANIECSPEHFSIRPLGDQALVQTNHCLNLELKAVEAQPAGASSLKRLSRILEILKHPPGSLEGLKQMLADRRDGPLSISRWPEDGESISTNACCIGEPGLLRFHACRGPADRGQWFTFELNPPRSPV